MKHAICYFPPWMQLVQRGKTGMTKNSLDGKLTESSQGVWLGNQRYRLFINAAGRGGSFWQDLALTRWRSDPVEDADGLRCWIRDLEAPTELALFADPLSPTPLQPLSMVAGGVTLQDELLGLHMTHEVRVDDLHDIESRDITLFNPGSQTRHIELTLCVDVVLNHAAADVAHPAFSKLFVQTSGIGRRGILARRRARSRDEHWPVLGACLMTSGKMTIESSRSHFQGRGFSLQMPAAMTQPGPLSGTVGNVLDPVLAFRCQLDLAPGASTRVGWRMAVAATDEDVCRLLDLEPSSIDADISDDKEESVVNVNEGYGCFSEDGSQFHIPLSLSEGGRLPLPPMPWVNVIANPDAGLIVSEQGAGYTWSGNSREHRLTPWSNDPMLDPHGEVFYLRDEANGEFFSLTPGPRPGHGQYLCSHAQGFTCFDYRDEHVEASLRFFVPVRGALRIVTLSIVRKAPGAGKYSVFVYQRPQLCADSGDVTAMKTWVPEGLQGVICASHEGAGVFAGRVAYSAVVGAEADDMLDECLDRGDFIGLWRSPAAPAALLRTVLGHVPCQSGSEPCLAHQIVFSLQEGKEKKLGCLLGEEDSEAAALKTVESYGHPDHLETAFEAVQNRWRHRLDRLRVRTPDEGLNRLLNDWLPYQNLSCRIWGRSAFYQSGGAFGYRDQLQDAASFMVLDPAVTRRQILLHAGHQFVEGDVLHWWHPEPVFRGLRTRFSDDLLWLPYVTAVYVAASGDGSLLDERAHYLEAPMLEEGEDERFLQPVISSQSDTVYVHCLRALERGLTLGRHGLPLMGTGDWNDGMNRVGREGLGESVWLGFFICHIIDLFLPLAIARRDETVVQRLQHYRDDMARQINQEAWDGEWYLRAWYDDGTVLGGRNSDECHIDALVQAWSVISGVAPSERAGQSIRSALARLLRKDQGLLCLLAPPFVNTAHDPGYIRGYVAGVRENGGQYTHAACWFVRALAESGQYRLAVELMEMIGPGWHTSTPDRIATYKVEPYVIAADIYAIAPHEGRGGWSWYTGAAGWYHRVAIETILGFTTVDGCRIRLSPHMPEEWDGTVLTYRWSDAGTWYRVVYHFLHEAGPNSYAVVDGKNHESSPDGNIVFDVNDDGEWHHVDCFLPRLA